MKLAEALMLRADTQTRIDQLRIRLQRSAVTTEGDTPPESVETLLGELDTAVQELETLIRRINQTNTQTEIEPGMTITDALARRDALRKKRPILESLINHTSNALQQHRALRSELRGVSHVDISSIQKAIDSLSAELRRLDNAIQERNWLTELI